MSLHHPEFVTVLTPTDAVDRLAALHAQACTALTQALRHYLKTRERPSAPQRSAFRSPLPRLPYACQGEVPSSTRAYAKMESPGTYSVTVTHPDAWSIFAELAGIELPPANERPFAHVHFAMDATLAGLGAAVVSWPLCLMRSKPNWRPFCRTSEATYGPCTPVLRNCSKR